MLNPRGAEGIKMSYLQETKEAEAMCGGPERPAESEDDREERAVG